MSVQTEADNRYHSALNHVKDAILDLSEIAIKDCLGSEDLDKKNIYDFLLRLICLKAAME